MISVFIKMPPFRANPELATLWCIRNNIAIEADPVDDDEEVQYYAAQWEADQENLDWEENLDSSPEADLYYDPNSPGDDIQNLFFNLDEMDLSPL